VISFSYLRSKISAPKLFFEIVYLSCEIPSSAEG
jgi:hypothetical protein